MTGGYGPRRRVLVIVQGDLQDRPQGPEMRGLQTARAFAGHHEVTIAATTDAPFVHDGIPVVPRTRRSLWQQMPAHDVVIAPVLPAHLMSMLAPRRVIRVSDLYDPVELESDTIEDNARAVAGHLRQRRLQLRWSDIVISANARQQARVVSDLRDVARDDDGPRLVTVAMGLPEPPPSPPPGPGPLRSALGIPADDQVVLWWGTPWRWLDACGAVRAVGELAARRPGVHLVITAGKPRNRLYDPMNATDAAREAARELGILDRNVHFLTDWVALEDRHRYLADADVGITLHDGGPEARYAARTRYMDYLWGSLPSVLSRGDELADEMRGAGATRLVAPHDIGAAAAAIEELLSDPVQLRRGREACAQLAERYRWGSVMAPLVQAVQQCAASGGSLRATAAVARESGVYYAHRAVDRLASARS